MTEPTLSQEDLWMMVTEKEFYKQKYILIKREFEKKKKRESQTKNSDKR